MKHASISHDSLTKDEGLARAIAILDQEDTVLGLSPEESWPE